jgi:hypothetical protein
MIQPLASLFGRNDHTRVLSLIIPIAFRERVYIDCIVSATGLTADRVGKILDPLVAGTSYSIDHKDRAYIYFGEDSKSNKAVALYHLVSAIREEELIAAQRAALGGGK